MNFAGCLVGHCPNSDFCAIPEICGRPKPSWQAFRPPPFWQCPNKHSVKFNGAPLTHPTYWYPCFYHRNRVFEHHTLWRAWHSLVLIYDAVQNRGLDFSYVERTNQWRNKDVPIEVKVSTNRYAIRQTIRDLKLSLLFTPTALEVRIYR